MRFDRYLSGERFYWPRDLSDKEKPKQDDEIGVFQNDCSRVTLSAPFHRLQRKTQVLPYPKTDYPRSRLTHTDEVSICGRQIARIVGHKLVAADELSTARVADIEDVVSAACKAHDIGNPPFGHAGEDTIQQWASKRTEDGAKGSSTGQHAISGRFRSELMSFDGNAQGFRLLVETTGWRRKGGLQLTCAVLGAFSKYPWTVDCADQKKKKFGILRTDAQKLNTYLILAG